jgi:hypothetical protein
MLFRLLGSCQLEMVREGKRGKRNLLTIAILPWNNQIKGKYGTTRDSPSMKLELTAIVRSELLQATT